MAYPVWITKVGSLGTIPENDYYEIKMDAYVPGEPAPEFYFIAGKLPPGIHIDKFGNLRGVPLVTDAVTNDAREYKFTIRAKSKSGQITDRTFSLTISNIVPPEITPKNYYLGNYFDGSFFSLQLLAIQVNPEATLTWTLNSGALPVGLSLNSSGLISGFIKPLAENGGVSGYSNATYNQFGYDNSLTYKNSSYTFSISVFDGVNYDDMTYVMNVAAKGQWTADSSLNSINDTYLTIDSNNRYVPIITTPPQSLPEIRSDSNFAFKFDAIDPNDDVVEFSISTQAVSGFDRNGDNDTHLVGQGFDTTGFDQGTQELPPGLVIDATTGWLAGTIPAITEARKTYTFIVYAYKRDEPEYISEPVTFSLTVLGDITNTITWVTDPNLGIINNGATSELLVSAISNADKTLTYSLVSLTSHLPQGLKLLDSGCLVGRSTFEYFTLDSGATTLNINGSTSFDNTYTFTVKAETTDGSASSLRDFTIRVNNYNRIPYENIYLKALPTAAQRQTFLSIVNNKDIFPDNLMYRLSDPWFGRAKDIRALFLAGLNPRQLKKYVDALSTNHFNKKIEFGNVKTARALDDNFNVKYEVVYLELEDLATNDGLSPANSTDLTGLINPHYDEEGIPHSVLYPNSFENMSSVVVDTVGYARQGILPRWMTSTQENNRQLGLTRAVVLAYTIPGASKLIAYRLNASGIQFNNINFVADRYSLDNHLTSNFDIATNTYKRSQDTTFDRISRVGKVLHSADYAVRGLRFQDINNQTVGTVRNLGGLDGIISFVDGETLIFAQQELFSGQPAPNDGWNVINNNTITPLPGYLENLLNPSIVNKRAGIWRIKITNLPSSVIPAEASDFGSELVGFDQRKFDELVDWADPPLQDSQLVTLEFVEEVFPNDRVQVNYGTASAASVLYYDVILKPGRSVPEYTILPSSINSGGAFTRFDGYGTKIISNRDTYATPQTNDKYLKFPRNGVIK